MRLRDDAAESAPQARKRPSFLDLIEVARIDGNRFRSRVVVDEPYPLFGGQIAAQALYAAAQTVDRGRLPHSLHGYFVRPGDAGQPIEHEVFVERDGRSFSSRKVEARQDGSIVFTMLTSFHAETTGPEAQVREIPTVSRPEDSPPRRLPRLLSYEGRWVEQVYPHDELMTRFWARCTEHLRGDPVLNACALTYLSDHSAGIAALDSCSHWSGASLDHALWFHRPVEAEEWMLVDLVPHTVARGRGWYTGSVFRADGALVANLAQETVFRAGSGRYFPHEPPG
jgi:acyl-CoA thioesterase II